jgi:lipoprotein-releasing system ATP-binding protein
VSFLALSNLCKSYTAAEQTQQVLQNLQLQITKPELIAIMGPSGSGKSTLLKQIGLLDKPDAGEIHIDGVACSKMSDSQKTLFRREKLGFIFQSFNLLPDFTAVENVEMPKLMQGVAKKVARLQAKKLLAMFGIENKADGFPSQLSGGEQQRVAIARSLANSPKLLLADEPTGNLDAKNSANVAEILRNITSEKKIPIIIVTHDIKIAQQTDKIYLLEDGKLKLKK